MQKRILLSFFLFLSFFLTFFIFQSQIKNFVYLVFSPFQKFFWDVGAKTSNFFSFLSEISKIRAEKENLEREVLKLKAEIERLKEIERENQVLKKALNLKTKNLEILPARVLSKDLNEDIVLIDRGKEDGVFEGEVAITPEGVLFGKVLKVYQNFSKVSLISSKNYSFSCKIPEKNLEALAEGRGNLNLYLTFLPREKEVKIGDKILSSALGGKFPEGIFIGEIEKIEESALKPYKEGKIRLGFSLSDLEFIFLIKNFEPWKES